MIETRLEYLMYALALRHVDVLEDAERQSVGMLTNNAVAGERALRLAREFAAEQVEKLTGDVDAEVLAEVVAALRAP